MRRWVVVLVLATTLGACHSGSSVTVVVSKVDIPAGTRLDQLVAEGDFQTIQVPEYAVVKGAVTDIGELPGQTTADRIFTNEQVSILRLQGSR
jgi:Flp pilus assembly protein CpaB